MRVRLERLAKAWRLSGCVAMLAWLCTGAGSSQIPDDFPTFAVPGHEREMALLRELYWLHYPGSGPKATLWDEWLSGPALWPAVETGNRARSFRREWAQALGGRVVDKDGYVATHQHASIAHPLGWPFPFWNQGGKGYGWHFSFRNTVGPAWRPHELSSTNGWSWTQARDLGMGEDGWNFELTGPHATFDTPVRAIDTFEAPFLQLRWSATGLGDAARLYVAWATAEHPEFDVERQVDFEAIESATTHYSVIPMYTHAGWHGEVRQLRVGVANALARSKVIVQAFFTTFDTRHNINSQNFVRGCAAYFHWTRDLDFLRGQIHRMRLAMEHLRVEHHALERKVIHTTWVGHDGRTGVARSPDGRKTIRPGHGVGNNYWDLLPFGNLDAYATMHYYDALRTMAVLESEIEAHPDWGVPDGPHRIPPSELEHQAAEVRAEGNRLFWNGETGRFAACVDADGRSHDYGFTFLNLEAIYYGFATTDHSEAILDWITGRRLVEGDTSRGEDIYHWRFGPRATTRRNIEWYMWAWSGPEAISWGGQVQDGGAVLGFSYHDLMARLQELGPENAWQRLRNILHWYGEVRDAGGYRKYYDGSRDGSLQGGGTPGGLGLDHEFFESVLVPQIMLHGFLGFQPAADGFQVHPRLPDTWPELRVNRIRLRDLTLDIRAERDAITIRREGTCPDPVRIRLPKDVWNGWTSHRDGQQREPAAVTTEGDVSVMTLDWIAREPSVAHVYK